MNKPLIFLAFANDPDEHLDLLKEESRRVFRALEEPERKSYIKVHREESAEAKDIFEGFTRNKDQIAIFHYAGHAEGTHLHLEKGTGDARGLASLMGEQEQLKLVFLNGCSSKGQVATLFEHGVKAVIATSVPISDKKAMEFSEQFYEALAHRRTIGQAFKLAEAYLKTRYGDQVDIRHRSLSFEEEKEEEADDSIPWGLYIQESHKHEILNWKLPYYNPIGLPTEMIQYIGKSFTANRYIMLVLDEMCKYNPDIYAQMVEQRGGEMIKKDSKYYPEIIIRNFPWPIGSQVRLLRVEDEPNPERLQTLISSYLITGQLLYYILISDLWNHVRAGTIDLPKTFITGLPLTKEKYKVFDFWAKIPDVYQIFQSQSVAPFLPEFEMLVAEWNKQESPVRKAHAYLEQCREEMLKGSPIAELEKACLKCEQATSIMLKKAAFLARYRMLTIRNISMEQPRLREMMYELDMGALNALDDRGLGMYNDAENRKKASYTNSHSIVLSANEDRLDDSLNLSPFVVDKFTFAQAVNKTKDTTNNEAKIYLMAWEEENRLHYLSVDHQIFHSIRNENKEDQIHTDIQASAYQEGKKVKGLGVEEFDAFGEDPFAQVEELEDDTPKVFEILKEEFDAFKIDTALGLNFST